MGDLTRNFSKSEFDCKCGCGLTITDPKLAEILQYLRDTMNYIRRTNDVWIEITSGARCPKHNAKVGGAPKSKHIDGIACDFKVWAGKGRDKQLIYPKDYVGLLLVWFPDMCGIGIYSNRVHLDTRSVKARWEG